MKYKFKGFTVIELVVVIAIVLVLSSILIFPFISRAITEDTTIITVVDKTVKRSGDSGDEKYLIYTDNGTYEITDTIAYWRWDSSDLYGKIQVGKTYECKVYGFRIPILSEYKNIITASEVTDND